MASARRTAGHQSSFLKYGAQWHADTDPLEIEFECIRRFGSWEFRGRKCGNGLPFHVTAAAKLIWPWMYWHRWTILIVEEFLKSPGRTGCFGPSSSQKSHTFTAAALVMFYARPKGTTILISSTTIDSLRRRIWDYVVSLDKQARSLYPWLAGSLIESKLMLLADPSTADGRSTKDGVIGIACKKGGKWQGLEEYVGTKNVVLILICDECFPSGTLVDTPEGPVPIEQIRIGDSVVSANGTGRVSGCSSRDVTSLIRLKTKSGKIISCTSNHPFLTQEGWIKACELNQSHIILSADEAMRIMRQPDHGFRKTFLRQLLLSEMVASTTRSKVQTQEEKTSPKLRMVRTAARIGNETLLQPELLYKLATFPTELKSSENNEVKSWNAGGAQAKSGLGKTAFGADDSEPADGESGFAKKSIGRIESHRPQTNNQRREWNGTDRSRTSVDDALSGSRQQLSDSDGNAQWKWIPDVLQSRYGMANNQVGCRSGRGIPQQFEPSCAGREKVEVFDGDWVDSVAIYQPPYSARDRFSGGGTRVYNLQVEGHPSYSVNGLLVHNCQFMPMGFLDALANLESNDPCYAAVMGNLPDVHNPLGAACEPRMGWEALPDTEKTRVYDTKWKNGRAIQLIGMDSPNLDFPEGKEPYKDLIGRRYIEQCAHNYGRESDKFNMFASGKIPRSSMDRTVFTKSQCVKFNAMEKIVHWSHEKLTRGYALDAAYSGVGGDRTVGAPFIFGKDALNIWRFWLGDMKIYSGSTSPSLTHAEAIALEVRVDCEAHGVQPEHFFFDGTGRSELTSALAKHWSPGVVPIEFGGPATDRPGFTGERHFGNDQQGDLKTCRELFDRFVSELWFAIRECILSDQMRGLTEEFIMENSQRKWELVRGAKYKLESKDGQENGERTGMKARGLRSPDTGDMLACALEGARRLGFPLGKLAQTRKSTQNGWFAALQEESWRKSKQQLLIAA